MLLYSSVMPIKYVFLISFIKEMKVTLSSLTTINWI